MTKIDADQIREACAAGMTMKEAAANLGVTYQSVYQWARKLNLRFKPGQPGSPPGKSKGPYKRVLSPKGEVLHTSLIDRALATDAITAADIMEVRDKAIRRLSLRGWKPEAISVQLRIPVIDVHRAIAAGKE